MGLHSPYLISICDRSLNETVLRTTVRDVALRKGVKLADVIVIAQVRSTSLLHQPATANPLKLPLVVARADDARHTTLRSQGHPYTSNAVIDLPGHPYPPCARSDTSRLQIALSSSSACTRARSSASSASSPV